MSKHNVLIIGGDMNAQTDNDETNKFCLHNSLNKNGEYLTDFSLENRVIWVYTKFQKKEGNYVPTPTQIILNHR